MGSVGVAKQHYDNAAELERARQDYEDKLRELDNRERAVKNGEKDLSCRKGHFEDEVKDKAEELTAQYKMSAVMEYNRRVDTEQQLDEVKEQLAAVAAERDELHNQLYPPANRSYRGR